MPFTGQGTGIQNANDVFFSGVTQSDVLRYNGTTSKWNNVPLSLAAANLTDGIVSAAKLDVSNSPSSGNVLSWNGSALEWAASGAASTLDGISDVTIATPSNGQVLKYNGSQWVNGTDATSAAGWPNHVLLTDFAGADDTAKMRTALATLAAETSGTRRVLVIPPGTVLSPGSTPFQLSNGIRIVGGVTPETEFSYNCRVTISGAAPNGVFQLKKNNGTNPETGGTNPASNTETRGVVIANIGWEGPGTSQICHFFEQNFTERLSYSLIHGCSFDNFTTVMHQRLLGVTWTGMGYCNNSSDTPFRFSGSDYKLFMDGFYLDSPNLDDTKYLLEIVSGNKAVIGSIFVTGDGPTPVRVSAGQMVRICNMEMEAEGVPRRTAGAGLFVAGGNVVVENAWFFRTMDNPSSTGRGDNGVIHQTGGVLRVMNASFGEYNNSETHTENHVYSSGGQTYLYAPLPWNLEANSGTGGTTNARALQTAKAGSGQIFLANHTAL